MSEKSQVSDHNLRGSKRSETHQDQDKNHAEQQSPPSKKTRDAEWKQREWEDQSMKDADDDNDKKDDNDNKKSKNKKSKHEDDDDEDDKQEDTPWQERPPYKLEDNAENREAKYHGSCHCKDVTFDLFADPKDAHFCHCDDCQKLHGAPAHWSCIMPKTDVLFTCDTDKLMFYRTEDNSNEYKLPLKISCKRCHSMVCDEGRKMMLMYPSLVDFDKPEDREPFTPRRHVFYKMRALDIHDGQEKYEGMQFKSPLMDEDAEHQGTEGITGKGSRKDRDPNEKDSKDRSDNPK